MAGGDADNSSSSAAISATGRYVAFSSGGSDLVPGDTNQTADLFVRDMAAGTTTLVSVDAAGDGADGPSYGAAISPDGRYVAFVSEGTDLLPGPGDGDDIADVFVRDMAAGTTTRVTVDTAGEAPDGDSFLPSINATGEYVTFTSIASDLVADDGNDTYDVFLRDLAAGTTTRVTADLFGGDANGSSSNRSTISHNGRYVSFTSAASDLVPGDANGADDVFVRDMAAGTTVRVSVDPDGRNARGDSYWAAMNATGRYVTFTSGADDLVPDDDNHTRDVFVRNLG